ncbi:hypothetical protein BC826DRAFT_966539 [Russula brevipes]|nr:hypothetical protein BC826DRAFT_966539 [Russula brevipes]
MWFRFSGPARELEKGRKKCDRELAPEQQTKVDRGRHRYPTRSVILDRWEWAPFDAFTIDDGIPPSRRHRRQPPPALPDGAYGSSRPRSPGLTHMALGHKKIVGARRFVAARTPLRPALATPLPLHFPYTSSSCLPFSRAAQSTWGGTYLRSLFCIPDPPLRGCWHAHEIGGARWAIASVLAGWGRVGGTLRFPEERSDKVDKSSAINAVRNVYPVAGHVERQLPA